MRTAPENLIETHLIGANTREVLVDPDRCPALAAAGIRLCGVSDTSAPYRMVRRRLEFTEVLAVLAGSGRVWVDGDWQELRAGGTYLAPREATQAFYPTPGRSWRIAWVHYHDKGTPEARVIAGDACRVSAGDCEPLGAAVLALQHELAGEADAEWLAHLSSWVDLAARRLARTDAAPETRLRVLWTAVEREPASPWTVAALAKKIGVGEERLRRICQEAHGASPMDYVTRLRMERAALLLRATPMKVETIAEEVGYGSVFAFSAAFQRVRGVRPSVYRRRTNTP